MSNRTAAHVWPETLRRWPGVKVVYLDLNHWITLAKAQSGHSNGKEHAKILGSCLEAVNNGSAVFPLTSTTYMELNKNARYQQRKDLLNVIEPISRFIVVIPLSLIQVHEVEAMLDHLIGQSPNPAVPMDYLDRGVARAFGVNGRLCIYRDGQNITDEFRAGYPEGTEAFDRLECDAQLALNRVAITGPTESEIPEFRQYGWNPRAALDVLETIAQREVDQVATLNRLPKWRRGRIRDVFSAREVYFELNKILVTSLDARRSKLTDVIDGSSVSRRALDVMPSFDVSVTLKTSYHRDPNHRWSTNDIHDIHAMALTLPYCDVVVTDSEVKSHIDRNHLGKRLDTVVLSSLAELTEHL